MSACKILQFTAPRLRLAVEVLAEVQVGRIGQVELEQVEQAGQAPVV